MLFKAVRVGVYAGRVCLSSMLSQSQFVVSPQNGFLPRDEPLVQLPAAYDALEQLMQRMPITMHDGSTGLLGRGCFGDAVMHELPNYTDAIDQETNSRTLIALFRDYAFMTSAYLLEPCGKLYIYIYIYI